MLNVNIFVFIAPDEVDDPVVIDGDILVSKEQAAIYKESGWDGLVKSEAWDKSASRWNKKIPYKVATDMPDSINDNIKSSLDEIAEKTCLSFHLKGCFDFAYLYFGKGDGYKHHTLC